MTAAEPGEGDLAVSPVPAESSHQLQDTGVCSGFDAAPDNRRVLHQSTLYEQLCLDPTAPGPEAVLYPREEV